MVIVVFRARVRADADLSRMEVLDKRMLELASAMPGFVSYKDFSATDNEALALVEFDSEEHAHAWRMHPEHREAQQFGREHAYQSYEITVCSPIRRYGFSMERGRFEVA